MGRIGIDIIYLVEEGDGAGFSTICIVRVDTSSRCLVFLFFEDLSTVVRRCFSADFLGAIVQSLRDCGLLS